MKKETTWKMAFQKVNLEAKAGSGSIKKKSRGRKRLIKGTIYK
jgi:hypothetical protein